MAIDGVPKFWSTDFKQLIPIILDLIVGSWKTFAVPTKPRVYEPRINREFCRHLRNHKDRSKHFFTIWAQAELLSKGGALIGQPDLIFSPFTNWPAPVLCTSCYESISHIFSLS